MNRNRLTLTLVRENDDGTTEELLKDDFSHVMILGECYDHPSKMCECLCQTSVRELAMEITQTQKIIEAAKGAVLFKKLVDLAEDVEEVREDEEPDSDEPDPEDKLADLINGGKDNGGESDGSI